MLIKSPDDVFTSAMSRVMKSWHHMTGTNPLLVNVIPTVLIWTFVIIKQLSEALTVNPYFLFLAVFNISIIISAAKDNKELLRDCTRPWNTGLFSKYSAISVQRKRCGANIRLVLLTMAAICPTSLATATEEIMHIGPVTCLSVIAPIFALLWFSYAEASEPPVPDEGHPIFQHTNC